MDYDYEHEAPYIDGRILWGRIAVLVVALLAVFLLGRCTAAGGIPPEDLDEAEQMVEQLELENDSLRQENAALAAGQQAQETADDSENEGGIAATPAVRTYVVRSGDTLYSIAEEMYGEGTHWRQIADANGIDQNNRLRVGDELVIPPLQQ